MSKIFLITLLSALVFAGAQIPLPPEIQLSPLPGVIAPVKEANGDYRILSNVSTIVLPQMCTYYPTGVVLNNSTNLKAYVTYSLDVNVSNAVLEAVRYRNSSIANAEEIVAKLCSTLLNAPQIMQGQSLLLAQKYSGNSNNTQPQPKKTGPFYTYGDTAVVQIAANMYMLYAESKAEITTTANYPTGVYVDTAMVADPSTITYNMYPTTNCVLVSSSVNAPKNEIVLKLKQQSATQHCIITNSSALAVAMVEG